MVFRHKTPSIASSIHRSGLSRQLQKDLQPIIAAAKDAKRIKRRFGFYGYLASVYGIYQKWDDSGLCRSRTRELGQHFRMRGSADLSPIRALLKATMPDTGPKQLSRWTRALQFASYKRTPTKQVKRLFRANGGVAGCARLAAKSSAKHLKQQLVHPE